MNNSIFKTILRKIFSIICLLTIANCLYARNNNGDTIRLNYDLIYGYALKGNIKPALALLPVDTSKMISAADKDFITNFDKRFKFSKDESNYLDERKSNIDTLLRIFRDYWRLSLEDATQNYDSVLVANIAALLIPHYHLKDVPGKLDLDTLDNYMTKYIHSAGLLTNGFGKVGKYYDLLVWKGQIDTSYKFFISNEKITAPVVFMNDFVSLGWEDYATLGRHYPGGWTTHEAIFCVKKAYNVTSEEFLVGLLAHEGRHFADYSLFPQLSSSDLEYRAKLIELSLYKQLIYKKIQFFINEADHTTSQNSHPFADYCLIRNLSRSFFNMEFEKDISAWKNLPYQKINDKAKQLLQQNTIALRRTPGIKNYIR